MSLSRQSVEILLDLIEIKVSALQIQDRDDARELNKLRKCRQELLSEHNTIRPQRKENLINPTPYQEKLFRKNSSSRL
jgi:hypothetical protein